MRNRDVLIISITLAIVQILVGTVSPYMGISIFLLNGFILVRLTKILPIELSMVLSFASIPLIALFTIIFKQSFTLNLVLNIQALSLMVLALSGLYFRERLSLMKPIHIQVQMPSIYLIGMIVCVGLGGLIVFNNLEEETPTQTEFYAQVVQTTASEQDRLRILIGVNYYQSYSTTYQVIVESMDGTKRSTETQFTVNIGEHYEQFLVIDTRDFPLESQIRLVLYDVEHLDKPERILVLNR